MIGGIAINVEGEKNEDISGKEAILNVFNSKGTRVEEQFSITSYSIKSQKNEEGEDIVVVTYGGATQTLLSGDVTIKGTAKIVSGPPGNQLIRCKGRKVEDGRVAVSCGATW